MRNLHYKIKSYRLNDKTIENIEQISHQLDMSYNLTFVELIKLFKKRKIKNLKK